ARRRHRRGAGRARSRCRRGRGPARRRCRLMPPTRRAVTEGLFADDPPRLLGGRCDDCGHHHFPRLDQCPYCGAVAIVDVELSDHGTLWGWTTVTALPPGALGTVPYGFGVVELPE